ncbi:hypothetical protein L1D31_13290 [Vibrio sp. Isolate23]|uniref:hypothetical protein n=1 Tax=Vibrio sp. Isolate23 TaxID=2908533 RepID=UPI001EFC8ABE|nr:hypothetical protein [Vibrio sp. Isolate23]MCG9683544.1 hypothetical protein [Vibrio sp. Isolate23]
MKSYPLSPSLPKILDPAALPSGVSELGQIVDTSNFNQRFVFYKNNGFLSIVEIDQRTLPNGTEMLALYQSDFPSDLLTWLPNTLALFRQPPGTSPHSKMMTSEECIDGEMLAISRDVAAGGSGRPGYSVYNFSRAHHDSYGLMKITWMENFLYQGGLLDFIEGIDFT